jgi:hypothetical protein
MKRLRAPGGHLAIVIVAALLIGMVSVPTAHAYPANTKIRFPTVPAPAALSGMQMRFNEIPVRPLSAISQLIYVTSATPTTSAVSLGKVPRGAQIIGAIVAVTTAFNAQSTNVLTVGPTSNTSQVVASGDVTASGIGTTLVCHHAVTPPAVDTEYWITFTSTGTKPTAGRARVTLLYVIP